MFLKVADAKLLCRRQTISLPAKQNMYVPESSSRLQDNACWPAGTDKRLT